MFAGQKVGIKQVSDNIWLVSFIHYDLGYFDHETCRLEPIENPFIVQKCYLCVRHGPNCEMRARQDWTAASLPRRRSAAPPVARLRRARCEPVTPAFGGLWGSAKVL